MHDYRGQSDNNAGSGNNTDSVSSASGDSGEGMAGGAVPPRMSDCRDLVDVLYAYVDGECDERLRVELRRHVGECPSCLKALGIERQVRQLVQKSCGCRPAPEELRDRISAQLRVRQVTYEVRQRRDYF